jgi:hypothetical protein
MKVYAICSYAGRDMYDHNNRVTCVGSDPRVDFDQLDDRVAAYIEHCITRIKQRDFAWATIDVITITDEGTSIERRWSKILPVKEKIKLNVAAKDAPQLTKVTLTGPTFFQGMVGTATTLVNNPIQAWAQQNLEVEQP